MFNDLLANLRYLWQIPETLRQVDEKLNLILGELKDMAKIKEQVGEFRGEFGNLRETVDREFEEIKADNEAKAAALAAVQGEVAALNTSIDELNKRLADFDEIDVTAEIQGMKDVTERIKSFSDIGDEPVEPEPDVEPEPEPDVEPVP